MRWQPPSDTAARAFHLMVCRCLTACSASLRCARLLEGPAHSPACMPCCSHLARKVPSSPTAAHKDQSSSYLPDRSAQRQLWRRQQRQPSLPCCCPSVCLAWSLTYCGHPAWSRWHGAWWPWGCVCCAMLVLCCAVLCSVTLSPGNWCTACIKEPPGGSCQHTRLSPTNLIGVNFLFVASRELTCNMEDASDQ